MTPEPAAAADDAGRIGAFLTRPEASQRIKAAFLAGDDPRLQQMLSDALAE